MRSALFLAHPIRAFGCRASALAWLAAAAGFAQTDPSINQPRMSSSDFGPPPERVVIRPAPIFFPPFPPPLDQPISRQPAPSTRIPTPAGLADYVSEFFYPALGSQLHGRTLAEKHQPPLAAYRASRHQLLEELRRELARQREAEPAARQQALAALARRQAPQLAELEKTAERLRAELIPAERNWNDYREWKLSDRERRGFSPLEIAQVMRAYAFYQRGLLPAQRRLLREIALELANAAESAEKASAAQPYVFFSPDTARVTFPTEISSALAAMIASYQSKKALLKKELYDTIYQNDGKVSLFSGALRALPEKQAARIAELEELAEQIRVGLGDAALQAPGVTPSPLPRAMIAQLSDILQRHVNAQQEARGKVERLVSRASSERVPVIINHRFDEAGLKYSVVPRPMMNPRPETAAKIEALQKSLADVAEDYGKTLAALVNERDELRRTAGEALGLADLKAVDSAFTAAIRESARRETETAYQDYRTAVFLPGLSPEQRRLLFNAAIEDLRLPLPRGELQPTRRGNSW